MRINSTPKTCISNLMVAAEATSPDEGRSDEHANQREDLGGAHAGLGGPVQARAVAPPCS